MPMAHARPADAAPVEISEAADDIVEEAEEEDDEGEDNSDEDYDYDDEQWAWEDEEEDDDFDRIIRSPGWARRSLGNLGGKIKPSRKNKKKTIGDAEWMPNEEAPNCLACDRKFSMTVRRHHCRRCGAVFCSSCTKARLKWKDPNDSSTADDEPQVLSKVAQHQTCLRWLTVYCFTSKYNLPVSLLHRPSACFCES
eukprot:SAG31_NODE_7448_length_1687_cov_1.128463_4_plen_196_part_01